VGRLKYILDTNAVTDYINNIEPATTRLRDAVKNGHELFLCHPVYYEIMRGLLKVKATRKIQVFSEQLSPQLIQISPTQEDWNQAAQYWADMRNKGRQLSDVDLLIAATATRLDGVIVTSDDDFDALPLKRENWRNP
jgi:predicted nucleic acid-binding protein